MEEQLYEAGVQTILKNVEDLALKTYVVARFASRTFHKEIEDICPYMMSSDYEKVLKLVGMKTTLAKALQ